MTPLRAGLTNAFQAASNICRQQGKRFISTTAYKLSTLSTDGISMSVFVTWAVASVALSKENPKKEKPKKETRIEIDPRVKEALERTKKMDEKFLR